MQLVNPLEEMARLYQEMKDALPGTLDQHDRVCLQTAMADLLTGLANAEAAEKLAATFREEVEASPLPAGAEREILPLFFWTGEQGEA